MCHKLTNLTKAHKDLDDWKDTIQTMIDRGASIPDDKVDTLAKYLAANFGPKDAAPAANAQAAAPAAPPPASDPAAPSASAPAAAKVVVELPDGDGKAIATENCQACHKLTNLTKAHKDLDDWKDTVQTMIDRGANVPADQIDTLVQYLGQELWPEGCIRAFLCHAANLYPGAIAFGEELPGNANLPIGAFQAANREIGVPGCVCRLGLRLWCVRAKITPPKSAPIAPGGR